MEQKRPVDNVPTGDGMVERNYGQPRQEMAQGAAGTTMQYIDTNKAAIVVGTDSPASAFGAAAVSIPNAHDGHVIGTGGIGTHYSELSYHNYPQHTQIAEASAANAQMLPREMQEQRQSLSDAATTPSTRPTTARRADLELGAGEAVASPVSEAGGTVVMASSAITIQSLLNSPLEEPAGSGGTARGRRSIDATSEPSTISEHIAKENARFRQNSSASSHLPAMLPRVQQPPTPTTAPQDSGPDSQSSYH
ncbi:hypothetical protein GGI22_008095, partial [Coemansia erecta]